MSDQVQNTPVLQQVSQKLEEAQKALQQCTLEQIECNLELEKKEKTIVELQEELAQFRALKITLENEKKYPVHKEKIFKEIKNSNDGILFQYDSYDVSIIEFLRNTSRHILRNPTIMKYLIDNMDLESKTEKGWKPIHFLSSSSHLEVIIHAIEKGADIEATTNLGSKPFHFICSRYDVQSKDGEMIRYFIEKGVDLNFLSKENSRPIYRLCEDGHLTCFEMLMEKVFKDLSDDEKYKISIILSKRAMK